ncbi:TetR/AcrR family transcriptional regulator [Pseudonocardia acaciae]|uniref:TetR/AcrR family transcriptional regulator n=1 Tax=Pseudonocardia acaciae TaxID=551276 RepID=UPI0004902DD4|nr:TetR/AcrR family transcriptional regulator [Pseudonocardia acaciae]
MTTVQSGSGDLSRSLELLWRGREPMSRGPKPGLTLERLVAAAVALADREGVGALSMRKVAAELGVGTMSLYRYVPGKSELIDLMLDHVYGEPDTLVEHRGKPWRTVMELVARGTWEIYRDHPWLLQVNQARPILGPNALAGFDFALAALDGLGLTGQERVALIVTLDNFVTGTARTYTLARQASQETGISDEDFWAAQEPILEQAMATGAYPQVAALPDDAFSMDGEQALEFGLRPLLDGFERLVASRRQSPET